MLHRFVVAIGAGCAAALLFAVSAQSSILAMALAYLAPLPIMIATLGWGLDAGAIAAAISIAVLAVVAEPVSALVFAASVAAPAWALGGVRGHAARAISAPAEAGRAVARLGWRHCLAGGAVRNARQRRGADGGHRHLWRLQRRRAPRRGGGRRPRRRRVRRRAGQPDRTRVRRRARALRPSGDRRLDAAHAVRQSLCARLVRPNCRAIFRGPGPTCPHRLRFPGRSGSRSSSALRASTPCPLPPRNISRSAPAASERRWRCRDSRSRTRCRAVSRCGPSCWLRSTPAACLRAKYTLPVLAGLGIIDGFLKLRSRAALIASPTPTGPTRR